MLSGYTKHHFAAFIKWLYENTARTPMKSLLELLQQPASQRKDVLQRVVVVGTTGSGKTTFARRLAAILDVPHIELDALHWQANWEPVPKEVLRERARHAAAMPRWVADGNYSKVRDILWGRATAVIWLNYPFPIIFGRLLYRTLKRIATRERLYSGNTESFRRSFLSRDSILLWLLRTYGRRRREYPLLSQSPEYAHIAFWECRAPHQANAFLKGLQHALINS